METNELVKLLKNIDVAPNRQLGQNFLIDPKLTEWIVDQLDIQPEDTVVEVGPGTGALTRHLIGKGRRLILIEKDTRLAEHIKSTFAPLGENIEVINEDAVNYDPRPLFRDGPVKFIGNLPYSAGTEIMRNLLTQPSPIGRAVVMLQKEVCDRICAAPRTKPYGILSLVTQAEWTVERLKTVGAEEFYPQPEILSSVIRLDPRPAGSLPLHSPQIFRESVKQGFSRRRKQLHNNLPLTREEWDETAARLGLPSTSRAEELSLQNWIDLSNEIDKHPSKDGGQSGDEIFDIVDENDEVTGQATRAETHANQLLHRAIHIFVFNKAGELYLQKRSHLKDTHAEKWDSSASGHVDSGENYDTSAVRELEEELMVRPKNGMTLIGKLAAGPATDQEFVALYRCEVKGKIRTHGNEVATGGFFPIKDILAWINKRPEDFARGFIACFELYCTQAHQQVCGE